MSDENEPERRQEPDPPLGNQSSQQPDVPFVQNDIASMTAPPRAIRPAAFYDTNAQVFPPLIVKVDKKSRSVHYIDLGLTSARAFWEQVVLANYEEFKANPCPASAFNAVCAIWHLKSTSSILGKRHAPTRPMKPSRPSSLMSVLSSLGFETLLTQASIAA